MCIGIIKTEDEITNEIKYRIGVGYGENEGEDIELIAKYGAKFRPEVIK